MSIQKIFISYRISDSDDLVSRLVADLTKHFGKDAVFHDKTRLTGGQNWTDLLEENARNCQVMLVVIGATWKKTASTEDKWEGIPRLLNPDDWVRKEITFALDANRIIIPVLLNGTQMPSEDWLETCKLNRLYKKMAMSLSSTNYESDLLRLIERVRQYYSNEEGELSILAEARKSLRNSYLHWVVNCHERLEFRGIRYARGGAVTVELKQLYLALL